MPENKRAAAATQLVSAINLINAGSSTTPPDLTRVFFEALTIFASTMTGHTSVIANNGETVDEFVFIYRS